MPITSKILKVWNWYFFSKFEKFYIDFKNAKKTAESFSILGVMAFEGVKVISLIYDKNTCDRQSTCYQTVLRFQTWLTGMFSNSICPGLMQNYDKGASL